MAAIFWHLWYVVFKDVQRCQIALRVCGQDHGKLKDVLHMVVKKHTSFEAKKTKSMKPW